MQRVTSRRQRWAHLYPGMLLATNVNVPKWKSLCEPAILPLTTMHFPSPRELVRDFEVNTYPVKLKDSEYDDPSRLLDELVRQRLANAFQLAVQEGEDETGHRVDTKTNKDNDTKRTEYLLHSGRTAHQLVYDALENEIRVTEYVEFDLFSRYTNSYRPHHSEPHLYQLECYATKTRTPTLSNTGTF